MAIKRIAGATHEDIPEVLLRRLASATKQEQPVEQETPRQESEGRVESALDAGSDVLQASGLPPLGQAQEASAGPLDMGLVQAFENRIPGSSQALFGDKEQQAKNWIIQHESEGNPNAQNPNSTAFGLGQLIRANREAYAKKLGVHPDTVDPDAQSKMMDMYVADRYGSYSNAMKFWKQNEWY